jgi:zinc/manganese transport system substrate-binding protein
VGALASCLALAGCQAAGQPPLVIAADGVLCDLGQRLAGPELRLRCLLEPGQDPHSLRLTPQQSQELREARRVLVNGYGLSPALERQSGVIAVAERAVPASPLIEAGRGNRDPHVWHDPRQAQSLVRLVANELSAVTANARAGPAIQRRAMALQQVLQDLDQWNRQQLSTVPAAADGGPPVLATDHRAYASFARAYTLRELPLVDNASTSATLRPTALATTLHQLSTLKVRQLFPEPGPPGKVLQRLSALSGVPISPIPLTLDGLASGPPNLIATLVSNTCAVTVGLGGHCDRRSGARLIARWRAIGPGHTRTDPAR